MSLSQSLSIHDVSWSQTASNVSLGVSSLVSLVDRFVRKWTSFGASCGQSKHIFTQLYHPHSPVTPDVACVHAPERKCVCQTGVEEKIEHHPIPLINSTSCGKSLANVVDVVDCSHVDIVFQCAGWGVNLDFAWRLLLPALHDCGVGGLNVGQEVADSRVEPGVMVKSVRPVLRKHPFSLFRDAGCPRCCIRLVIAVSLDLIYHL